MAPYNIAIVRFPTADQVYPVNCAQGHFDAGAQVLVRIAGRDDGLRQASVVEMGERERPCKSSIVCAAERAEAYGLGPPGVSSPDGLVNFLLGALRWICLPVMVTSGEAPWRDAYFPRRILTTTNGACPVSEGKIVLVGEGSVGRLWVGENAPVWGRDGRIEISADHRVHRFSDVDGDPYRQAAAFAEGDLVLDLKAERHKPDRTLRRAISGFGPAYLCDDEFF